MKIKLFLLTICVLTFGLTSCSDNARAKTFGGEMTFEVPADKVFVNVTWKGDELWVLTKERKNSTNYLTYTFLEDNSSGFFEGTVVIKHLRPPLTK
jgi:uncharacterized lipoprotein YehR (DUF1307 family)